MACSHPILALDRGFKINDEGKKVRDIKILDMKHRYFNVGIEELKEKYGENLLLLPCGKCYSCAIDYSRKWASRIMLEAKNHSHNCFITLTYNESCCPERLSKRDVQLFIKRLRKEVGVPIRYFLVGERGDESNRPHYHAIIFGYDFPDKVELKRSGSGMIIFRSPLLEKLWTFGISSIGTVSPESSQYVSKYSLKKKVSGEDNDEFVLMSRRPGIGVQGYDDPSVDWNSWKVYLQGKKFSIPRYFEKIAENRGDFIPFIAKENHKELGKNFKSKKYFLGLEREEFALHQQNEERIYKDCLKVRLGI